MAVTPVEVGGGKVIHDNKVRNPEMFCSYPPSRPVGGKVIHDNKVRNRVPADAASTGSAGGKVIHDNKVRNSATAKD